MPKITIEKLALITVEAIADTKKELHEEIENLAIITAQGFHDAKLGLQKSDQGLRDVCVRVAGVEEEMKLVRREMNANFEALRAELQGFNLRLNLLETQ